MVILPLYLRKIGHLLDIIMFAVERSLPDIATAGEQVATDGTGETAFMPAPVADRHEPAVSDRLTAAAANGTILVDIMAILLKRG